MAELLPLPWGARSTDRANDLERIMKVAPKRPKERERGFEPSGPSEKRFRYPAPEQISEVSCPTDPQRWTENDQPGDVDGPDARIS